jgi:SSS family solute:Na+ symporter
MSGNLELSNYQKTKYEDATWLAIGASIFASNIGSEHLIGLAGAGASSGMAMAHWEIQGWMILILGWVFVPFYTRSMVYTMPEFLERRYNPQSRTILSVISLVSYVLTKVAVTVYAGGLVFQQVFGIKELWGIDFFWIAAIGLVVLTALYTIFGGMKSVLYTSVLQTHTVDMISPHRTSRHNAATDSRIIFE